MKILFLCTAHNSLSQRLYLALSRSHTISIEFALSDEAMISAVALFGPDLIICPFLTTFVPKEIYEAYLTLIIHPGPPGDAGPSAIDWVLMGDDGATDNSEELLNKLYTDPCSAGRTHWGITILQAIEKFDAGPVWAFEQFELDIDQAGLTKSELYRGPITQAAVSATIAAIARIRAASGSILKNNSLVPQHFAPTLKADESYGRLSVAYNQPFQGGKLHHRPLLKANQRKFDVHRHTAQQISRRIRCGDSQPGVLSKVFGISLYIYGGILEDNTDGRLPTTLDTLPAPILGFRNEAVCLSSADGKGVWITHIRRLKAKADKALWPKVPATTGLMELGLITAKDTHVLHWPLAPNWKLLSPAGTFQEVWIEWSVDDKLKKTAHLYFDFYNGAMSTQQCSRLIDAMDFIVSESTRESPVQAVVLMGGSYFSNGIALNVIEAAKDPSWESWLNINRIDDVVHYLLHEFPARNIVTVAAIRGNAAAGGVALATACDIVVAGSSVVLNPAYRAVGLYGSEYHSLSYYGRCGKVNASKILRSMTPLSPLQAQSIGLVDYVFPGGGVVLEDYIKTHIDYLLKPGIFTRGQWKKSVDLSPAALARARANELGEMSLDFWSARAARYHARRFDFVRKVKSSKTPLRFAIHRRQFDDTRRDEEETDDFDSVEYFQNVAQEQLLASLRTKLAAGVGDAIALRDIRSRRESIKVGKEADIMFSCYYRPSLEEVLTPPETPWSPDVDRVSYVM